MSTKLGKMLFRIGTLLVVIGVCLLPQNLADVAVTPVAHAPYTEKEPVEKEVLGATTNNSLLISVNNLRTKNKRFSLKENSQLTISAQNRACYIYETKKWSHIGYVEEIRKSGYLNNHKYVGENLAKNFKNDTEVLNAWLNSPSHKKNLLEPAYINAGIGKCGDVVVLHFGTL